MNNNDSIRISVGGDTVFVNKDDFKVGNRESKNKQRRRKRGPRNPQPKEWLASNLSQMKIADYKPFNVDIIGLRRILIMEHHIPKNLKIELLKI